MKLDKNFKSSWHKENVNGYNEAITDAINLLKTK